MVVVVVSHGVVLCVDVHVLLVFVFQFMFFSLFPFCFSYATLLYSLCFLLPYSSLFIFSHFDLSLISIVVILNS